MEFITGETVAEAYEDAIWRMRVSGKLETSRNGDVKAIPSPVFLTIEKPECRVLIDPVRQCNPYFHLAEAIWMFAGKRQLEWLLKYNKRMLEYSDDGISNFGAYGYRWRHQFYVDQICKVVELLREHPETRRAVIAMWDPEVDLAPGKDLPCNTHIYFRKTGNRLDMTVCNRSNDLLWGMLGSNVVHMTMLHELIAWATESSLGRYQVFTNNLHVYTSLPNYQKIMDTTQVNDIYRHCTSASLLGESETLDEFLGDAERCVMTNNKTGYKTWWFRNVASPMLRAYEARLAGGDETGYIEMIKSDDWRLACEKWKEWKNGEPDHR